MLEEHFHQPEHWYMCGGCGRRFRHRDSILTAHHAGICSGDGGDPHVLQRMRFPWEQVENAGMLKPEFRNGLAEGPHELPADCMPRLNDE